ncbi:MAG: 2-C-methyl-D-erythritol 4-phosphate cytidylyltransferase [Gemmatimonadales bacterium]
MSSPPNVAAIVVAAGRGERAGGGMPKQFRPIGGVPMLLRTLRPFLASPLVDLVVVVLPPAVAAEPPAWLAPLLGDRLVAVAGAEERMGSVECGLAALPAGISVVAVHDGARPFVSGTVIDAVIAAARAGTGAIAAVPVADTIKAAVPAERPGTFAIGRTVPRDDLWRAQTPQAFPVRLLRRALAAARGAGRFVTDEASAVEALGEPVLLVPDRTTNLKVTTEEDFGVAEAIARGNP